MSKEAKEERIIRQFFKILLEFDCIKGIIRQVLASTKEETMIITILLPFSILAMVWTFMLVGRKIVEVTPLLAER